MIELAVLRAESMSTAVTEAMGAELRDARESLGESRGKFVRRLPSGIKERTLLSYEHGARQLTLSRLVELAEALGVDPGTMVRRGLQRARLHLECVTLHVDLHALLADTRSGKFRPMVQWARNALNEHPHGVAEVDAQVVRNLALFAGCSHLELAEYLAQFAPPFSYGAEEPEIWRPQ